MGLLDFILPNRCLECNHLISKDEVVCENCHALINFTHWEHVSLNPLEQKLRSLFPMERAYALMAFEKEGLSRKIIHQLKYSFRPYIGRILAQWCAEKIHLKEKPDFLVTVPLHPKKETRRGYNQLHLFADKLAEAWNIPHLPEGLKRNFNNKPQAKKDQLHRTETAELFSAGRQMPEDKQVLLIDDICTTGNTLAACSTALLRNQNKVSVLVMATED